MQILIEPIRDNQRAAAEAISEIARMAFTNEITEFLLRLVSDEDTYEINEAVSALRWIGEQTSDIRIVNALFSLLGQNLVGKKQKRWIMLSLGEMKAVQSNVDILKILERYWVEEVSQDIISDTAFEQLYNTENFLSAHAISE